MTTRSKLPAIKPRQTHRKPDILTFGVILASPSVIFLSLSAFADTLTGKVVKITDGDTLYVLDANYEQHKIRLAGLMRLNESRRMDWLPVST